MAIVEALNAGAEIDRLDTRRNSNGRRALNYAAYFNRVPAVRVLLARGASVNLANTSGFTPVHHAAEGGATDALMILLGAGADVSLPNVNGRLPIDTATSREYFGIVQILAAASKKP